jgi:RND family efflux transporter MFP subunit
MEASAGIAFSGLTFSSVRIAGRLFAGLLAASVALTASPVEMVLEPVRAMVVSAPIDGVIEQIAVDEGDPVAPGQLLVAFERAQEELRMQRAQEVLRKREFDYAGVEQLFKDNMTSETEMLEKQIELRVAQIDLAAATEQRDRRVIESVQSGVVTLRLHEDGEYVERGTPLLELVDESQLDARAYVDPAAGVKLRVGDTVWVRVPLLELSLRSRVIFIDPLVDPSSGLMRVRVRVDNTAGNLKSGLRGWLSLTEEEPLRWP